MSLIELTLEGTKNKIDIAIERLRTFEPPEGYYLAFSGGKDSQVIYELAKMSGVKFGAYFMFTSVDPPELLKFIKDYYPDVVWKKPRYSMWHLIENKRMPPTRIVRYCCGELKERGGAGKFVITGVRRAESARRSNRGIISNCRQKSSRILNPIVDWLDADVWNFINDRELPYCCLYDEGYKRIGCVLCPMKTLKGKKMDIDRYPNFYKAYLKAFGKMLEKNKRDGTKVTWQTPEDVMDWWINARGKPPQEDTLFN